MAMAAARRAEADSPTSMEMGEESTLFEGGFPEEMFLDTGAKAITDGQKCSHCLKILRNPRQRMCGHLFCLSCIEHLQRVAQDTDEPVYCPKCVYHDDVVEESVIVASDQLSHDYAMVRVLSGKNVKCPQEGCSFRGKLREYEKEHELKCPMACMDCPNLCGERIHLTQMKNHLQNDCQMRKMKCNFCGNEYPLKMEEEHTEECPTRPADCDLCGKGNLTREQLAIHKQNECRYFRCTLGCNERVEKSAVEQHYKDLQLLKQHMLYVGKQFENVNKIAKQLSRQTKQPQQDVVKHDDASGRDVREMMNRMKDVNDQISTLDNICSVFKVEFEKLFDNSLFNKQRLDNALEAQRELQERVQRLEQAVQIRDVQLMERDLRLKELEEISYDGTLIWRIENFSECRRKARDGEMTSIYSPAFYTSRWGYKLCARLYLNGDGIGKGTHISFFFVVMRGKYDGLLRWPFQQKVTMMLLDYTSQHHVMDAFRPDNNSASFHKPKNEMNVASGCPLFMPISALNEKINNHVKDDVAYFKIIVDVSDIPY